MTPSNEHVDPAVPPEAASTSLLPEKAKAAVEEIKAENAALEEANQEAEAEAEATAEQARLLAEATEDVLEELREAPAT